MFNLKLSSLRKETFKKLKTIKRFVFDTRLRHSKKICQTDEFFLFNSLFLCTWCKQDEAVRIKTSTASFYGRKKQQKRIELIHFNAEISQLCGYALTLETKQEVARSYHRQNFRKHP